MAAAVKFDDIVRDIRKRKFHPVYFLEGDEPYYVDRISECLLDTVLQVHEKDFNQVILYGKDTSIEEIVNHARRYPMMSEYQLVVVREAQMLNRIATDATQNLLYHYIEKPLKSTILVICYKNKTIDKRTSFAKLLQKNSLFYSSKRIYENQIPAWVISYCAEKSYKVKPDAAALLAEYQGNDLSRISNSLNKVMLNVPPSTTIDTSLIERYIGISKEYNNFELQNALAERDILKANKIVNYYRENINKHPLLLSLATLYSFFSKLMLIHSLPDKSADNLRSKLGVHPFFIKDYTKAARIYSPAKLTRIFSWLREYDMRSKGIGNSSAGHGELLQELVFKIAHV